MIATVLLLLFVGPVAMGPQDLKDLLRDLTNAVREQPAEAIPMLDRLATGYADLEEKDQKKVRKAIQGLFRARKDEVEELDPLFIAAGAALTLMGEEGEEVILGALKLRHIKARIPVVSMLVESLGQQKHLSRIDDLLGYVDQGNDGARKAAPLVAGATRGLASYPRAPGKDRKRIVKTIVAVYVRLDRLYEEYRADEDADPDLDLEKGFNQVEVPFLRTLQVLTGERQESAAEWQRWWQEHKDDPWDDAGNGA